MAMTARRRSTQIPEDAAHMPLKLRWLTFGVDCASQVIDSRFVSRRSLAKAYDCECGRRLGRLDPGPLEIATHKQTQPV